MGSTTPTKNSSVKKAKTVKNAPRKSARKGTKNELEKELSANDMMFKAWQRFYKRIHGKEA